MKRFLIIIILSLSFANIFAQNVLPKPNPPRLVNDEAKVLSDYDRNTLEQKLVALDESTTNQIVIVTIPSLNDVPIEDYAHKLFNDWGIGSSKEKSNGILILVSVNDRKARIEVGGGLEGVITDADAGDIIEYDLGPSFRQKDYYSGLNKAVESLGKAATGEYHEQRSKHSSGHGGGGSILGVIVVFFIIIMIASRGGRGGRGGGGSFITGAILGSMLNSGGRGWGGGGGGGGGFGGFGGGSSGGGGASGGW